jgi:very-short-patch-repair endonuclease
VCTPRRVRSVDGLVIHSRCAVQRVWHNGLPVTPVPQTLLDLAATRPFNELRYALAQAEFHGYLRVDEVLAHLAQGKPGAAALREAIKRHQPQLARTRSEFERRLLHLCERHSIPIPEFNVVIHGHRVDALWRAQNVVVELDGKPAHSRWGQIRSDRERDLILRSAGVTVLRYTWHQFERTEAAVAADVLRALSQPGAGGGRISM